MVVNNLVLLIRGSLAADSLDLLTQKSLLSHQCGELIFASVQHSLESHAQHRLFYTTNLLHGKEGSGHLNQLFR